MMKLLKNHFYLIFFIGLVACSSNTNVGQDDLSISEIEDIEKTGEFSEDDFFKDEEVLKESGIQADGSESDTKSKSSSLTSDLDVQDFEGEGFDKEDDFETEMDGSGKVAEFDEFDEFVTSDKVAKNEDIEKNEAPQIGDIAEQPTMTEEDIFSEFEESTDVAAGNDQVDSMLGDDPFPAIEEKPVVADNTIQPELDFEDAFNESETTLDTKVADSTPNIDTTLDTDIDVFDAQNSARDQFQDITTEETSVAQNNNFDQDFGPGPAPKVDDNIPAPKSDYLQAENVRESRTAKELLGSQYDKPEQIITTITRQVQSWIPVKKMKDEPYRQNGILLNALYIVREGENFKTIGEKIYGQGSASNLAKLNPFLNPRRLKVGEKVYYNSPNRPNDENSMLFYYDDIGRTPQYRQVEVGENIRDVSQKLLGHPRSWMEIWATNPEVVSKATVERAYRVKYFSKNNVQSMVQEEAGSEALSDVDTANQVAQGFDGQDAAALPEATVEETPVVEDTLTADAMNAESGSDPDFDKGFDDQPVAEGSTENGFDDQAQVTPSDDGIGNIPENLNNQVQEAGGLKGLYMGLDQKTIESIGMGVAGLVLIFVILMIARRRRQYAQATEVQEFDFTGSTKIDEQTKTHIDI
jgi:hypothetical protein